MLKPIIVACTLALGFALPAQAGSCPTISKQVSAKLAQSSMPAAKKAEVERLRTQGESQHKGGKHAESVATLRRALSMIE